MTADTSAAISAFCEAKGEGGDGRDRDARTQNKAIALKFPGRTWQDSNIRSGECISS